MKKKIYIAGKITGECETPELLDKCIEKFNKYAESILPSNPERIGIYLTSEDVATTHGFLINQHLIPNGTWEQYMKNDLTVMLTCSEVHFLNDWKYSTGAKIEHDLAEKLRIKIVYQ